MRRGSNDPYGTAESCFRQGTRDGRQDRPRRTPVRGTGSESEESAEGAYSQADEGCPHETLDILEAELIFTNGRKRNAREECVQVGVCGDCWEAERGEVHACESPGRAEDRHRHFQTADHAQ